jgi:hypothetical protein
MFLTKGEGVNVMPKLRTGLLVLGLCLLTSCAANQQTATPVPNDTSFSELKKEYDEANKKFHDEQQKKAQEMQEQVKARMREAEKAVQDAKTDQEKAAAQQRLRMMAMMPVAPQTPPGQGPDLAFAPRFLAFAEKNPSDPSAFESLVLALHTSALQKGPETVYAKALAQIRANHITSPEFARVLKEVGGANDDDSQQLLREVLAKNTDHKIQASACKTLAAGLENAAKIADPIKNDPELRKLAEKQQGKEAVEKLIAEADHKRKEAGELTKTLGEKFGDVFSEPTVGKPAPEIEGEDADSKTFKLSDYRGKVVLLDFWGNW